MTDPKFPTEEPGAGERLIARAARQQFVALVKEGFTEAQALQMVGQLLAVVIQAQMGRDE